jgi:hypothetical protein
MINKIIYLSLLIAIFIQCRSYPSMSAVDKPDFTLMEKKLYGVLQKDINKQHCDSSDANVLRSKQVLNYINWSDAYELYGLTKEIYPSKEWDKMYFIYYFSEYTDPIYGNITIVYSNGRESWGLSKDDNQNNYIRTNDCKNIDIWNLYAVRTGKFDCKFGNNILAITEFDNNYKIKRTKIYYFYGFNSTVFDVLYRLQDDN